MPQHSIARNFANSKLKVYFVLLDGDDVHDMKSYVRVYVHLYQD